MDVVIGSSGCNQWVEPVDVVTRYGQWVVDIMCTSYEISVLLHMCFLAATFVIYVQFLYFTFFTAFRNLRFHKVKKILEHILHKF